MPRGRGGFTLVELLIVIAIIGILAAIAVPAFMGQREKAKARDIESSAKGVVAELQSLLTAHIMGEPFVILASPAEEKCIEFSNPPHFKTCGAMFPGITSTGSYAELSDVINSFILHHQSKAEKSPFLPTQDLFAKTDPLAGSISITNTNERTIMIKGYGETSSSLIFNVTVFSR